jgi:hypothetical protein
MELNTAITSGKKRIDYKTLITTLDLEFMKQGNRTSSRLQRMMDKTLWRG